MQFKVAPSTPQNDILRLVVNGGQYEVFASGEIDEDSVAKFNDFVKNNHINDAVVLFDSPGGSLAAGIELGKTIRAMHFNTAIGSFGPDGRRLYQGFCASACAYAFAGGVYRFYYGDKEKLGIHQFYNSGNNQGDIGDTQLVSSVLINYLQVMGVDPQAFVAASAIRGDSMLWLTPDEAVSLGLANNGSNPTTAEIKMAGLNPYLKIEQDQSDVAARVLFACGSGRVSLSAGIVTTPEMSKAKESSLARTYLEADSKEILVTLGSSGAHAVDSVLWLERTPSASDLIDILKTGELGIWTENGGPMRWGATIDLRPARQKIAYFLKNCLQSQ
jgi:hypothetical protein